MKRFKELFHTEKPIIGMVHLLPLPGSPRYKAGGMKKVIERSKEESLMAKSRRF